MVRRAATARQRGRAAALWAALWLAPCAGVVDPSAEEKRLVWKYPSCDNLKTERPRRVDWLWFRDQLHALPYPSNIRSVFHVLENLTGPGVQSSAEYDEEVRKCVMGVPAAFFYLACYTLDTMEYDESGMPDPGAVQKVAMQYSVFENYVSGLHPGIINNANWTITEQDMNKLRKGVMRMHYAFEKQKEQAERQSRPGGVAARSPGPGEREQPLRIYVYEEEEVPQLAPLLQSQIYCSRGQWGMDVTIHDFFATSAHRTEDAKAADFFFVPGYAICVLEGNIFNLDEVDELYKDLVRALPYFNASGGRDHVFSFGSGMAHSIFQSWRDFIPKSIVLTPETELFNDFAWVSTPPFETWKDIAIPGALDLTEVQSLLSKEKPLKERQHLAAFFGRVDLARGAHPWVGGVDARRRVLELKEFDLTGSELLFGDNQTHDVMHSAYGSARFCLIPRGKSAWSLRLFEALFAGCVPVVLSDKWELPFEDFLDVTRFVIKWPTERIDGRFVEYLRSLPDEVVQAYMDEAKRVRCWYFYPPKQIDVRGHIRRHHRICPEEAGQDAFRGILRALYGKRRRSRTSPRSFYFRAADGSLRHVDADLQPLA